jgi:hypothetical protein
MPMALIENERTKLLANAFDRASTTCLTVGIAAPAAGYLYGLNQFSGWYWAAACCLWLSVAIGLHLIARRVLGMLE